MILYDPREIDQPSAKLLSRGNSDFMRLRGGWQLGLCSGPGKRSRRLVQPGEIYVTIAEY